MRYNVIVLRYLQVQVQLRAFLVQISYLRMDLSEMSVLMTKRLFQDPHV